MSLGGRPREGGHKRTKFSLNIETIEAIKELATQFEHKSKVVEKAIELLEKEQNPKKRHRLLKILLRKEYEITDSLREGRRQRFYENFNKSSKEEAIALWLFEAVDQLLHCFKIAWNMKDKEAKPSSVEYLKEYLDADLEMQMDYLREGFMWIGKNGSKALFQYLKELYYDTHGLYENFGRISKILNDIGAGKGETYDEYRKLDSNEAKKRGIKYTSAIDVSKDNL